MSDEQIFTRKEVLELFNLLAQNPSIIVDTQKKCGDHYDGDDLLQEITIFKRRKEENSQAR